MRRHRRKRKVRAGEDVQLNMTAMLDMAFQLLAFFILTFRASPIEAQISLRLPDKQQVTSSSSSSTPMEEKEDFDLALTIELHSLDNGQLDRVVIGTNVMKGADTVETLRIFKEKMRVMFEKPMTDSIVVKAGKDLYYESLMQVVDVCTRQKTTDGSPMTKISIVALK